MDGSEGKNEAIKVDASGRVKMRNILVASWAFFCLFLSRRLYVQRPGMNETVAFNFRNE